MEQQQIVTLLNADLEDEHGAIIQYLAHAYAMGEGEMACEIEAIAREEMRHLDWLAKTIVALGGTPSLKRGKMLPGGEAVPAWMQNNVLLEEGAISSYRQHIQAIDDAGVKRLLRRILSDEESHHGDFQHFIDKAKKEGMKDLRGDRTDQVASLLNRGVEHEYTVVLQYLWQAYLTPDSEIKRQLEDGAVNEMQHMGWLAEEMVGSSGSPRLEHTDVDRSTDSADMLRADISIEHEVAGEYDRAARQVKDPGLQKLFRRIMNHELYHAEVFKDLLDKK
ncbi:MAG: ferritin-like domain-containing protein [Chloroflexota bacterium]